MSDEEKGANDLRALPNESGIAFIQAREDAHYFGTGFLRVTVGKDGTLEYRRIDPFEVFIHPKADVKDSK